MASVVVLKDNNVSKALQAILRDPGAGWTIGALASAASFSRRFKQEFGIGPGAYRKNR